MKIESTKWGSRIVFDNGAFIGFAWKLYFLVIGVFTIFALVLSRIL